MRIATKIVLAFILMLILTGCVVVIKSFSGHHINVDKDYEDTLLSLEQEYKLEGNTKR